MSVGYADHFYYWYIQISLDRHCKSWHQLDKHTSLHTSGVTTGAKYALVDKNIGRSRHHIEIDQVGNNLFDCQDLGLANRL